MSAPILLGLLMVIAGRLVIAIARGLNGRIGGAPSPGVMRGVTVGFFMMLFGGIVVLASIADLLV